MSSQGTFKSCKHPRKHGRTLRSLAKNGSQTFLAPKRKFLPLSPLIQGGMDVRSSFINIFVHPESTMHILHLTHRNNYSDGDV